MRKKMSSSQADLLSQLLLYDWGLTDIESPLGFVQSKLSAIL